MPRFRSPVDDRGIGALEDESDDRERSRDRYATTSRLNIRGGPGIDYEKLDESPLAVGTIVASLHSDGENDSEWTKVRLGGADGIIGWVHGGYLRLV
jgi:hypothetical protein